MPLALTEDAIGMRSFMPSTPTGKIEKNLVLVPYDFIGSNTSLIESSENMKMEGISKHATNYTGPFASKLLVVYHNHAKIIFDSWQFIRFMTVS